MNRAEKADVTSERTSTRLSNKFPRLQFQRKRRAEEERLDAMESRTMGSHKWFAEADDDFLIHIRPSR